MKGRIILNKLQEFVAIINSKLGEGYVYGGQNDQPLTKEALAALVKIFGRSHYYYTNYSAERWLGKEYYDCSGLIVYALRKTGLIPMVADYTSHNIFHTLCTPISKGQLKTGDLCFNNTSSGIVHVGIYMGNNRVTHARGTFYGVVNTELFASFNTFGRLKFLSANFPPIDISFEKSTKRISEAVNVYEQPDDTSKKLEAFEAGSSVETEASTGDGWYLVNTGSKMGYAKITKFFDTTELNLALDFLSQKTGIDKVYWYKQAMNTKWLDVCFIKIAKSFGGLK